MDSVCNFIKFNEEIWVGSFLLGKMDGMLQCTCLRGRRQSFLFLLLIIWRSLLQSLRVLEAFLNDR